ncbi:MAG TPA: OmpA family protein [Kofleriaceae bacterium]|jgi:outer membrane protein OmpA-like peptidoglycan-associated protein
MTTTTKTIKSLTRAAAAALLIAGSVAGCGSADPSEELTAARAAYEEAHQSQARELVPDQLLEARQALDAAEAEFDDDENSPKARTLAYIAHRKALLAIAAGDTAAAKKQGVESEREYKDLLEAVAKKTRQKLGKTEASLGQTKAELEKERRELEARQKEIAQKQKELAAEQEARKGTEAKLAEAEQKLAAAMKSLEEIAKVKEDARGTIITLSGAVLFKTNESELLPIAEQQLRKVADALNAYDEGRKIVVAGHTDSRGSASFNKRLSLSRAESVRTFLVNSGVSPDRIRAVGKGKDEPIADNKSAEGRANNRRVEIIVEGVNR